MNYDVNFIPNTSDDLHCLQASWMMAIKYFKPDFNMPWDDFSRVTGFSGGKGSWAMAGLLWFKEQGFEVEHLDIFDYEDFAESGGDYLIRRSGAEVGSWQIQHTDMPAEQARAKRFIKSGIWQKRIPQINDIKTFLDKGYLVMCLVNSAKLAGAAGYVGHSVLVKGYDKNSLIIHDPGLPPLPNRKVSFADFSAAWADPTPDAKELNAVKLEI